MPTHAMDKGGSSSKRPNDSTVSEGQQRQKREKYTSVACNECKKRKIKCSGTTVCQRCEDLGVQCIYTANSGNSSNIHTWSSPFQDLEAKFAALEKQLSQLQSVVMTNQTQQHIALPMYNTCASSILPGEEEPEVGRLSRTLKHLEASSFVGPTNSLYSLNVGKSSLKSMGVQPNSDRTVEEPTGLIDSARHYLTPQGRNNSLLYNTLLCMGKDEAFRLIGIYSDELSPIYPFLDISHTLSHLQLLLDHLKAPRAMLGLRSDPNVSGFDSRDSDILMMVFASALIIEGLGQSASAEYMVDAVEEARSRRAKVTPADVKEVTILTMMSVYYFHCDEDISAWRMIGVAAHAALEMGLHRKESITRAFPDELQRFWAIRLFWCVYVLDRRWALGTGLPCAIHQSDIDPDLPEPSDTSAYLQRLVAYARISSKVSNLVNNSDKMSVKARKDESGFLDFQVQQWLEAIPPELQMLHPKSEGGSRPQPRSLHRSRVLLYVRANHIRIFIHRHCLLSATSITENLPGAKSVVEVAKDTIQILAHLNSTTNIYQTQQACFNYYLLAPLAALFLAVCHGPIYFSQSCRSEFHIALDLVKGFSSKSVISRRLWKTIRELKSLGPKLGVAPPTTNKNEQSALEAVPNGDDACLTGVQTQDRAWNGDGLWSDPNSFHWLNVDAVSDFGNQMTYDLADLYGVAEGNGRRVTSISDKMVGNGDNSQLGSYYPLEDNADVSKALETLF